MKATRFIVLRHGQTEWNVQGKMQGHLDSPLTPVGRAQAKAVADKLSSQRIENIYSSDLGRAYETAQIIATRAGCSVAADRRLRERKLGIFQGLTTAEMRDQHAAEYKSYLRHDPDYAMPGGESVRQRTREAIDCFEELVRRHTGELIVVVTHGGVLTGIFGHVLQIQIEAPRRFKLYNASLNTFMHSNGAWMLQTWGDVGHLQGIGTDDDF